MQKNRFQLVLIVLLTLLSAWFLLPTFQDASYTSKLKSFSSPDDSLAYVRENRKDIEKAQDKRLKLGLDLQGGMHVVLEVDVLELLENRARNRDAQFDSLMLAVRARAKKESTEIPKLLAEEFQKRQVRLSRYYFEIRDSDEEIVSKLSKEALDAVERAKQIIRNRVDQYGVAEPTILTKGGRRIIVELPGVSDKERVRKLLKGTAKLEFKLVRDPELAFKVLQDVNDYLARYPVMPSRDTSTVDSVAMLARAQLDSIRAIPDSLKTKEQRRLVNPLFAVDEETTDKIIIDPRAGFFVTDAGKTTVLGLLKRSDVKSRMPSDLEFALDARPASENEGLKFYRLYSLKREAELTGSVITEASATFSVDQSLPEVSMKMNDEGTKIWARTTGANIGKQIAIVLDGGVYSAPVVQSKIPNGSSVINGIGSIEEAKDLEIILKAGALPAPVQIAEERTVGPSLGADSVRAGIQSVIFGFMVVALFMIFYYRTAGFIADFALIFNILFVISFLAGFSATLTLPGIAGLVLTIGMAVDANVLIFERIREEAARGKSLKMSIELGYDRAFSAILDSHITTILSGALLYAFGIGPIQGFAVTLLIGVVASLFTAIVITRVAFDFMIERSTVSVANFG